MSFSRGFLNKRVTVLNRGEVAFSPYGRKAGEYIPVKTIWGNCTYNKGQKAMREGALDAYDVYMVRCDYHAAINRDSRLSWDNRIYQILQLNADRDQNEMQLICQEIIKQ